MGAYHFTAKIHGRASGASAVRAAAYRSGSRMRDERSGKIEDYTRKADVIEAAIFAPDGAPAWCLDREQLWNAVEAREKRKDAQLAQEFEINLPREFTDTENWRLITDFVRDHLVAQGRVCDVAFHKRDASDGEGHPHAHVLMPLRVLEGDGFGRKHPDVDWRNFMARDVRLNELRREWCEFSRARAAELGIDLGPDWDHRSYQDRGLDIEGQPKVGATAQRMQREGDEPERADELLATMRRNGERLLAEPGLALEALTNRQSTFTDRDLARWIHSHSVEDQFEEIFLKARELAVPVGRDDRGVVRFSTQAMIDLEKGLVATATQMTETTSHALVAGVDRFALQRSGLSEEQQAAAIHLLEGGDITCMVGYAGSGKSTLLREVRVQLEKSGWNVRGAALSGIAAEGLHQGSGISARTLASLSYAWHAGRDHLGPRDVVVIDEAGMIGSRQMNEVLEQAKAAGAKVILVGDPEQLQAIEAGAAFRAIMEGIGAVELTEIRRQRIEWQRDATRAMGTGQTDAALARYREAGCIREHATDTEAREALTAAWLQARDKDAEASRIILAHQREDVREINDGVRSALKEQGALGTEQIYETNRGKRAFAEGDRFLFLRNDKGLGVRNGMIGTVKAMEGDAIAVQLDSGARVQVDAQAYRDFDHGYAVTVHKSQSITVDETFVLATKGFDRHMAYVACSRHREGMKLFYSLEDFRDRNEFVRVLSRERAKDFTADYELDIAGLRGLSPIDAEAKAQALRQQLYGPIKCEVDTPAKANERQARLEQLGKGPDRPGPLSQGPGIGRFL